VSKQVTRMMVLGVIVHRGPLSGYGVEKTLNEWNVHRWTTIAPASIYQQIKSLGKAGMIELADSQTGRAVEHIATDAGREELHALLLGLLREEDFQPLSLLPLLHFTPVLAPVELIDGLERRIQTIDRALEHENEVISHADRLGPSYVGEVFRLTWHGLRADRQWCADFLDRLRASPRADRTP
jgi:DNA-binding PadR family transcriptional regulator